MIEDSELQLYYDETKSRWVTSYSSSSDRDSCILQLTSNQSILSGSNTAIQWNSVKKDTDGFYDAGLKTVVMPECGWYSVQAVVVFANNSSGMRRVYLYSTGAGFGFNPYFAFDDRLPVSGHSTVFSIDSVNYYDKGDSIYCYVFQSSGGGLNVEPGSWVKTTFRVSRM